MAKMNFDLDLLQAETHATRSVRKETMAAATNDGKVSGAIVEQLPAV